MALGECCPCNLQTGNIIKCVLIPPSVLIFYDREIGRGLLMSFLGLGRYFEVVWLGVLRTTESGRAPAAASSNGSFKAIGSCDFREAVIFRVRGQP